MEISPKQLLAIAKSVERSRSQPPAPAEQTRLKLERLQRRARGQLPMQYDAPAPAGSRERAQQTAAMRRLIDAVGTERIIDTDDLQDIQILAILGAASRTVARLRLRDPRTGKPTCGTGFMIGPGLLLTNHHVLESPQAAAGADADFDYQVGAGGAAPRPVTFKLAPGRFFATDAGLDMSVVAVAAAAADGRALADFGWLKLVKEKGKVDIGDELFIIQHPECGEKQIVLRNNRVQRLDDPHFVDYSGDTLQGSSGAPVLNEFGEVIALHYTSVPRTQGNKILKTDGTEYRAGIDSPDDIDWIANRGARASSLVAHLEGVLAGLQPGDPAKAQMLAAALTGAVPNLMDLARREETAPEAGDDGAAAEPDVAPATAGGNELTCVIPIELRIRVGAPGAVATPVAVLVGAGTTAPAVGVPAGLGIAANEKIEIDPNYSSRRGYSASFLGTSTRVPLPTLSAGLLQDVARLKSPGSGSDGITLKYHHYSVVMNGARRMAFFTAVNIDGRKIVQFDKREGDKWTIDPRIEATEQTGEDLYADNDLDRGHLVRRLDPGWGSSFAIGKRAVDDTFHFTNSAPQHSAFQRVGKVWQGLENYILDNADNADLKVSVFTGPRFRDQDRRYRGYRIPREYWKVVVMRRKNGQLHATAYLLSQGSQIADLPEEEFIFGAYRTFQKSIASIEQATGLDFGQLRQHDPLHSDAPEEAAAAVELQSLDDIVM